MTIEEEHRLYRLEQKIKIPPLSPHQRHVADGGFYPETCERCESIVRARQTKQPEWACKTR